MRARVGALLATVLVAASLDVARADTPVVATLVPTADARRSVAVGPAGQVYEPDGKGDWVRRRGGGIASAVTGAALADNVPIIEAKNAPPFKLKDGAWTAIFLAPKAKATLGTGARVLAAAGKAVFALDGGSAKELPAVGARVVTLAASDKRAVVLTDKNALLELVGSKGSWTPLKTKAPRGTTIRALLSDQIAVTGTGLLALGTMKSTAWPAGLRVDEVIVSRTTVAALATSGRTRPVELLVLDTSRVGVAAKPPSARDKKAAKATGAKDSAASSFAREPTPLDGTAEVVAIVVDAEHRVVIATRDGRLAVRAAGPWDGAGAWTVTQVRDELPAAASKAGSPPALSAPSGTGPAAR